LNDLTKPQGSLGLLETLALRYCLCRNDKNASIDYLEVYTFAGDHGVKEEKISPFPQEVTQQMVLNMAEGGAAVSVMCNKAGYDYRVVDMGVHGIFPDMTNLIKYKVREGTRNFSKEPAMTENECNDAFESGYDIGHASKADLVGLGEMGIGNTSSASAIYSLILDIESDKTVGMGTGSTGEMLDLKKRIVEKGVKLHRSQTNGSPYEILRCVGGLETAGMCGFIFGCVEQRIPVVIDGFISSAAALIAMRMNPDLKEFLFFSHKSSEKFHNDFLQNEGIRPILDLDLRLGEGTGSVLAMQIIQQALECYENMATFSGADVSQKE
jgi:nicotinate-nucleotide--dimethylbenzimidazole phosphoribosyltransferase